MGKDKRPKTSVPLTSGKQPSAEPVRDFYKLHPAWRIARLEMRDPFGWHQLDRPTLDSIRERLKALETSTWKEILVDQNRWNHEVPRARLRREAQERLAELALDDQEFFISLRLTRLERIWGFRSDDALTLLWWDPAHRVWDDGT